MQRLADRRAARGAAWLDEQHSPEWAERIDLQSLDMRSVRDCVRGQLYGDWKSGPLVHPYGGGMIRGMISHGFLALTFTNGGYRQLDQAWTREILNRRAVARLDTGWALMDDRGVLVEV